MAAQAFASTSVRERELMLELCSARATRRVRRLRSRCAFACVLTRRLRRLPPVSSALFLSLSLVALCPLRRTLVWRTHAERTGHRERVLVTSARLLRKECSCYSIGGEHRVPSLLLVYTVLVQYILYCTVLIIDLLYCNLQ